MGIIPGAHGNGKCVQLTGVTGHNTSAEVADVVYPILTDLKKPYAFATRGTTLVLTDTKDKIISFAVLLKLVSKWSLQPARVMTPILEDI